MRKRLPILAKTGCVSLQLDHKHIHKRQGDDESKALGLLAIVASEDGTRQPFTLGYLATDDATNRETVKLVKDCLEDYDLLESFKRLEIPITTDCALRTAMETLFKEYQLPEQSAICTCHNLGNLGKRCVSNLPKYLPESKNLLEQLKINLDVGRSLDNYFKTLEVNQLDRHHIGELVHTNWKEMDQTEQSTKDLKYLAIPIDFRVRFRNSFQQTLGLLSRWHELMRIKSNIHHQMHGLVETLDVGDNHFKFLCAIHEMRSHLIKLVDYYERETNFQSTETINSLIFGFEYALKLSDCDQYATAVKLSFLDCLTEQLCSHKAIKNQSGAWIWKKCNVPTRIRRMDKVGAFAFPGEQKLILPRLRNKLKQAKKDCRQYKSKFQVIKFPWLQAIAIIS